jgi:hypothetical protein
VPGIAAANDIEDTDDFLEALESGPATGWTRATTWPAG